MRNIHTRGKGFSRSDLPPVVLAPCTKVPEHIHHHHPKKQTMFMSLLSHLLRSAFPPTFSDGLPAEPLIIAPGSLSCCLAFPPSRLFPIAPCLNPNSKDGQCTGVLLGSLSHLSISQSGSSAGKSALSYNPSAPHLSFIVSRLPFYWEVKTLFLLFLALPQTEVSIS